MKRDSQGPNPRRTIITAETVGGKVMQPTDPNVLEEHILAVTSGTSFQEHVFHGTEALKKAAEGNKPHLRRGQLIFGTVSVAHHQEIDDDPILGPLANMFAPVLTGIKTGQARQYAYLHVAVYAGQYEGVHYVIENGGNSDYGKGYIGNVQLFSIFVYRKIPLFAGILIRGFPNT